MKSMLKNIRIKKIQLLLLVVAVFLSFFLLRPALKSDRFTSYSMDYLSEKEKTVMEVTGAATGASVVLAAVPGDSTTPIANKLADVSGYMAGALAVILFEKYLVPFAGSAVSLCLIPAALILTIIYLISDKTWFKRMGIRLFLLSALLVLLVPLSVTFSKSVDRTYQKQFDTAMQEIDTSSAETRKEDPQKSDQKKTKGNVITDLWNTIKDKADETAENISVNVTDLVNKASDAVNHFVEMVAVMILTSFLVPVVTFILLLWLVKIIFNAASSWTDEYIQISNRISGQLKSIQATVSDKTDL